ncbi:hypothetical protein [Phocaeicola sp.]|uniref:hypothetical protein n=1 Tax=Phocaeicola sp. TaxID=2773926 RepID=UPI003A914334
MKQLIKLFSIVFCAMAMYSCGNDDEPGKSTLQDQFIDVNNGEYTEGSLPVGETSMLQAATFDEAALPGGTSYLTLKSYEELDYVNIGVQGESGYLKVKLDAPATAQGRATTEEIYTYTVLVLLSQKLSSSFTLEFTTVNKQGEISTKFTSQTNYIEAGTGDLQVNLRFSNEKDVDLYVVEPNGNIIYFGQPFPYYSEEYQIVNDWLENGDYENEPDIEWGKIGLDIDSNAACDIDGKNSENIFFKADCMQKGTYQVWVNMFENCDPSIATNYTIRATYKGIAVTPKSGSNPASGVFPINTPDNNIGDELTGATKVMEFTINEGIEPGRSAAVTAKKHLLKKEFNMLFAN